MRREAAPCAGALSSQLQHASISAVEACQVFLQEEQGSTKGDCPDLINAAAAIVLTAHLP